MRPMPLTGRQQHFVQRYAEHGNGARAAVEAGYSAHTARVIASENIRKPAVAAAIEKARKKRDVRDSWDAETVRRELACIARSNIFDVIDKDWNLINPHQWPEGASQAFTIRWRSRTKRTAKGEHTEIRNCGIAARGKLKALELLGRHLGMFDAKKERPGTFEFIIEPPELALRQTPAADLSTATATPNAQPPPPTGWLTAQEAFRLAEQAFGNQGEARLALVRWAAGGDVATHAARVVQRTNGIQVADVPDQKLKAALWKQAPRKGPGEDWETGRFSYRFQEGGDAVEVDASGVTFWADDLRRWLPADD